MQMFYRMVPVTIFLSMLLAIGCGPQDQLEEAREPGEALEAAQEDPVEMTGETITFTAEVERVFGDCAYEVTEEEELFQGASALTMCQTAPPNQQAPTPPPIAEGDTVTIMGVVQEMTREGYEEQTTLTLPEDVFEEGESRLVVMIQNIQKVEDAQQ